MEEEKVPNEKENVNKRVEQVSKKQNNNKKFIIKFIVFIFIMLLITGVAVYYTVKFAVKKDNENTENKKQETYSEEKKKSAEDSKYAINSYSETYNTNGITFTKYYDRNGKVSTEYKEYNFETEESIVEFIQIDGLKDKDIQKKINDKLKDTAYSARKNNSNVSSWENSSFSNVLSITYSTNKSNDKDFENKKIGLNIDLTTGKEIPFEKVFISSAPINSYIAEGLYKSLSWNQLDQINRNAQDDYEETYDMKEYDAKDFEDNVLKVIKIYEKNKDNLQYSISEDSVTIYNIIPEDIINTEYYRDIEIKFLEKINDIAIYKRYITDKSIFEDDSLAKEAVILTKILNDDYCETINYGNIRPNIFMEEVIIKNGLDEETKNVVKNYIKKISDNKKTSLISEVSNEEGIFYLSEYYVYKDENYIFISDTSSKATCSKDYFKEEGVKDLIRLKSYPRAEVGLNMFDNSMKEDFPNLKIQSNPEKEYYISETGELIGNSIEEVNQKIKQKEEQKKTEELNKKQAENTASNNNIDTNTSTNTNTDIIERNDSNTIESNITENSINNTISNTIEDNNVTKENNI